MLTGKRNPKIYELKKMKEIYNNYNVNVNNYITAICENSLPHSIFAGRPVDLIFRYISTKYFYTFTDLIK